MKRMLSNGIWATKVEDFEDIMEYNDFKALEDIVNSKDEDEVDWEARYKREELHSDALYQQNTSAYVLAEEMITYLLEAKRMNKTKLIDMLKELQNTLENY